MPTTVTTNGEVKSYDFGSVVPPSNQVTVTNDVIGVNFGAKADAAATTDIEATGYIGLFKRFLTRFATLITLLPAALSTDGRLKTQSNIRNLTVIDDKIGATVESTVLANNAASETGLNSILSVLITGISVSELTKVWSVFQHLSNTAIVNTISLGGFRRLHSFTATNINTTDIIYLQFFDKSTSPALATGTVPLISSFKLDPNASIIITSSLLGVGGLFFSTGLTYAVSTTRDTYTAPAIVAPATTPPNNLRATFWYENPAG